MYGCNGQRGCCGGGQLPHLFHGPQGSLGLTCHTRSLSRLQSELDSHKIVPVSLQSQPVGTMEEPLRMVSATTSHDRTQCFLNLMPGANTQTKQNRWPQSRRATGAPDQPTRNQVGGKKKTHRLSPGVFTLPDTTPGAARPLGPSGWSQRPRMARQRSLPFQYWAFLR